MSLTQSRFSFKKFAKSFLIALGANKVSAAFHQIDERRVRLYQSDFYTSWDWTPIDYGSKNAENFNLKS